MALTLVRYFIILVIVAVVLGTSAYFGLRYLPIGNNGGQKPDLSMIIPAIQSGLTLASQTVPQLQQKSQVLGVDSNSPVIAAKHDSIPSQAAETIRYNYCQQVVKDYESRYATENTASSSSLPNQ